MKISNIILAIFIIGGCSRPAQKNENKDCCKPPTVSRWNQSADSIKVKNNSAIAEGMVYIEGGTFTMGARENRFARADEFSQHQVKVNSFYIDIYPVTNAQFREFVEATGYITTAEIAPDWEEIKKQVPPGTPRPPDEMLVPASMVFESPTQRVSLNDYQSWWSWVPGANWKHPEGPDSSNEGKDDYPVVQVS